MLDKVEFILTSEHGSWLNMAECEIPVLFTQCLDGRIPNLAEMKTEIEAWQNDRNQREAIIDWPFQDQEARIQLRHLYPKIECLKSTTFNFLASEKLSPKNTAFNMLAYLKYFLQ